MSTSPEPASAPNMVSPPDEPANEQTVSSDVFDDLVLYFKYASTAYSHCHKPNGNFLVHSVFVIRDARVQTVVASLILDLQFDDDVTETRGFIVRDDKRKEVVVALRGSSSMDDLVVDVKIALVPFKSPGVHVHEDVRVHTGFLSAWNSVALDILSTVRAQLRHHPEYSLVSTGHSLGGSIASLASISFKCNFPTRRTRMYTYGQPRTGNLAYAELVNSELGPDAFRAVHTNDGVPTMIPTIVGYHHHGVEYWQFIEPPLPITTRHCNPLGEDLLCSALIPSGGINVAHMSYFGIPVGTPFCD